jgi:hypothetical protein
MTVQCPYCRQALSLTKAKPGRFTPVCPQCGRTFQLTVSDDPEKKPVVGAIPSEREKGMPAQGAGVKSPRDEKPSSVPARSAQPSVPVSAVDPNATVTLAPTQDRPR